MEERDLVDELAVWLASAPVAWVRRSSLALVVAHRAGELLRALRTSSGGDASVRVVLLAVWERALSRGRLVDAAVAATALAEWAVGIDADPDSGVVEDRAVDLTLRAGVVASDARHLACVRERGAVPLWTTREECVALAGALGADADRSRCDLGWLELEDAAARGAGEALVALLLAQQEA